MIAVCPNPYRDRDLKFTAKVQEMLEKAGFETKICPLFADEDPKVIPENIESFSLGEIASKCTLAIVIGGDGTILSAVRELGNEAVPILGVNLGTMGFMATLEVEDLEYILKAAKNEMEISRRMMLDMEVRRGDKVILSGCALNDIIIHGHGDCIKVTAWCKGDKITSYSGDGIILATPTGSTGYSMSAGGPIVEPSAANIILSPICAHTLSSRSFVLSPDREITVRAEKFHGRKAYVSVDGIYASDLENGDIITVRRSANCTLMADMGLRSFYDIAYEKLT